MNCFIMSFPATKLRTYLWLNKEKSPGYRRREKSLTETTVGSHSRERPHQESRTASCHEWQWQDAKRINLLLQFAHGQAPPLAEEVMGVGEETEREWRLLWTLRPTLSSLSFLTFLSKLPGVERAGNPNNAIYFGGQRCCTKPWALCGSMVRFLISGVSDSVSPSGFLLLVVVVGWLFLDQTCCKGHVHQSCFHSYCSYSHFLWTNSR